MIKERKYKSKSYPVGGVHPQDNKLSAGAEIKALPLPQQVAIPLSQHIGAPAKPLVKAGDMVQTGQLIAQAAGFISANIHSPVSGTVLKIDKVADTSGYKKDALLIRVEGDEWCADIDRVPDLKTNITLEPKEIIERIKEAGIVGLGGATFPSFVKLMVPEGKAVEYLVINGAECEPFLTSDHRLMLEKTQEIMVGIQILLKALGINKALIGIEDNKPDALKIMRAACEQSEGVEAVALKTQYPQGAERQLIKSLINREIPPPPKGLPIDVGCVVFNVATCFAVYEAVQKNKPLIERVVTVSGMAVKTPGNFLVRLGIPVNELLAAAGGVPQDTGKVISGGPMMGKAVANLEIPITKGMGGILLVPQADAFRSEMLNCIHCGRCVQACPLGLEPYLLMSLAQKNMFDRAYEEHILNCCECGCCVFTCPAKRPLLDYIRLGKATVLKKLREGQQK